MPTTNEPRNEWTVEDPAEFIEEQAFAEALLNIAAGGEREATRGSILDQWPVLDPGDLNDILADALKDALKQGVEREDIDPSWFAT